jgi:hypothetical protein
MAESGSGFSTGVVGLTIPTLASSFALVLPAIGLGENRRSLCLRGASDGSIQSPTAILPIAMRMSADVAYGSMHAPFPFHHHTRNIAAGDDIADRKPAQIQVAAVIERRQLHGNSSTRHLCM